MRSFSQVAIPTAIIGLMAAALFYVAWQRHDGSHVAAVRYSARLLVTILPLLVCAFLLAGLINELLPKETVARWVGNESGMRGIMAGAAAGMLTPGGPFICYPIAAGMLGSGAAVGPTVAYVAGWSMLSLQRIPIEAGIVGWRFTLIKCAASVVLVPVAGIIAQALAGAYKGPLP